METYKSNISVPHVSGQFITSSKYFVPKDISMSVSPCRDNLPRLACMTTTSFRQSKVPAIPDRPNHTVRDSQNPSTLEKEYGQDETVRTAEVTDRVLASSKREKVSKSIPAGKRREASKSAYAKKGKKKLKPTSSNIQIEK